MSEIFKSEHYLKDVLPMLNLVDDLRAILGNESGIKLPSIAVIGSQSAGKSTVIERLSGVQLPRGVGMVTKCPLVMRLRNQDPNSAESSSPSPNPPALRIGLELEHLEDTDQLRIAKDVDRLTKQVMGQADERAKKFGVSHTPIHLEVVHPSLKDLTLIDLPGLFSIDVNTRLPIPGVEEYLKELYYKFIESPECLMVCVVPATTDLGTQLARGWATELDPQGMRSVGVLTQVDRAATKETYDRILDIGTNATKFVLGVIALRNPSDPSTPAHEALSDEKVFFEKFAADVKRDPLPPNTWGLEALVKQLVDLQGRKIAEHCPKLRNDVLALLEQKRAELAKLPTPLRSEHEASLQSNKLFSALSNTIRDLYELSGQGLIDGKPVDPILLFQPRTYEMCERFIKRISKVQTAIFSLPFVEKVKNLHKDSRGRQLDDMSINNVYPLLVAQECASMKAPATELVESIFGFMMEAVEAMVQLHIGAVPGLARLAVEATNALQEIMRQARVMCYARIDEQIKIECEQTFTVNHYYADNVAKMSDGYLLQELRDLLKKDQGRGFEEEARIKTCRTRAKQAKQTARAAKPSLHYDNAPEGFHVGNQDWAVLELLVKLHSYRKVVQKRFADSIATYCRYQFMTLLKEKALETLMEHFTPDELFDLMREDAATRFKRVTLEKSIERLEKARDRIRQHGK